MVERTAGIRPLGNKSAEHNYYILKNERIVRRSRSPDRDFSELGTFMTGHDGDRLITRFMWAQKLLDYDPKECRLSIYQGQLIVRKLDNTVLKSIPPQEIREVDDIESERGIVRRSGYVLADHFYSVGHRERINVEDFENILESADNGQEPFAFSHFLRVKVDPTLIGRELWMCIFKPDFDIGVWDTDAVVIDPETRKLVDREVLHPLSPKKWGKK